MFPNKVSTLLEILHIEETLSMARPNMLEVSTLLEILLRRRDGHTDCDVSCAVSTLLEILHGPGREAEGPALH